MPPNLNTTRQILDTLNGTGLDTPWIPLDGFQALTTVQFQNNSISFNPANGIIIKTFLNTRTSEVKIFAAKFLGDIPERSYF